MDPAHLPLILVLLAAAVVAVAVFRKLRVSPILGYFVAGAVLGPGGAGLVSDPDGIGAVAEFGVVFLLFLIGLGLSWERLHALRWRVYAVGTLQVVVSTLAFGVALLWLGFGTPIAFLLGGALAFSSTAFVLQLLSDGNRKASALGRLALATLLIQDFAVIPLLVLIPALAGGGEGIARDLGWVALKALAALLFIFVTGRLLLRPLYRLVASLADPEIFTALTLLVVLGTAWLTHAAGLSLALGAFLAGLLLAETEYRHQVEADVLPYKGLFLGLFFMAIGMQIDLGLVWRELPLILGLALGLMAVKAAIFWGIGRALGFGAALALQAALLLSQGSEFAFILFRLATEHGILAVPESAMLIVVVTVSMALTPLAVALGRMAAARLEGPSNEHRAEEATHETADVRDHVIVLGFGRTGQTVAKLLAAEDIPYVALDLSAETVGRAQSLGLPVYYGDGARLPVLLAVGVERARAVLVTLDEPDAAERAVRAVRAAMPTLPLIARGHDLERVLALEAAGADVAVSELFEASLQLGGATLRALQIPDPEISRILGLFRDKDYALARGTFTVRAGDRHTPYGKMIAFQKAVVQGAILSGNPL